MNEGLLKKYYEIFTDCWKLFRKFSNPTKDDKFWQELKDEAHILADKDKSSELRRGIVKETVLEIHRIWKKEQ